MVATVTYFRKKLLKVFTRAQLDVISRVPKPHLWDRQSLEEGILASWSYEVDEAIQAVVDRTKGRPRLEVPDVIDRMPDKEQGV